MDKAANLINPKTLQTKPSSPSTLTFVHSEKQFDYIWRGLQAARLLTKDMVIDGTDYHYWRASLRDLSDKHLLAGLKQSQTFHGFFTWAEFRKLCVDGYSTEHAQHRQAEPTTARLGDYSSMGNKGFQELCKVTSAMSAEEGDGPITKATKAGKLHKHFVRGKSAQEIINHCQKLYGN